jgi:hypothetical protein
MEEEKVKAEEDAKKENNRMFYEYDSKGNLKIIHRKLLGYLEENGFAVMNIGGTSRLVRIVDNIIDDVDEGDLSRFISNYLESINELEVLNLFIQGVSAYLNKRKYEFLPKINWISDKDPKDCAYFYFKNSAVLVTKVKLELIPYTNLNHKIWQNRILNRDFNDVPRGNGQFEDFCFKLSKEDPERLKALKTAIGYLMHRHNDQSVVKAIILLDENATNGGKTNGGTGKSLIFKALSQCLEAVLIDGKNMKRDSRFSNQRISHSSDIVCFDDVNTSFNLDMIYSMTTSGVVIEKKGKDECVLKPEDAPKILITTNYHLAGPGGSSDIRRRYQFEVPGYFSDKNTPKDEYGNLFFDEWDENEWNIFDCFMIECVQLFLKEGLLEAKPLKLKVNKFTQLTSTEFHDFTLNGFLITGKWIEKKDLLQEFTDAYPDLEDVSSNTLTRWVKKYAEENDLEYTDRKIGGKYEFKLIITNDDDDANE